MHFNPKTWPWWAWTVVSLIVLCLILISVALAIRQQGINDLRQEIAALRAAGRPAMLEDVYPRLRTLDPGRQARAWDLFGDKSPAMWNHDLSTYGMMGRYGSIQKGGFDPKKIASLSAQVLLDSAIVRSTWRTLWQEGSVELNTLAWLFLNHPDSETISFNDPHFNFQVSSLQKKGARPRRLRAGGRH